MEESGQKLLSDEIYDILLQRVQKMQEGEKIPSENEISKEFHASRICVRSALQKLQGQKFIITRPGKGSFVLSNRIADNMVSMGVMHLDLSADEYRYVIELREALEFTSIDLLCREGTAEDLLLVKTGLDEMIANKSDSAGFVKADYSFHAAIIKGSHNPLFQSIFAGCKREMMKYFVEIAKYATDDHSRAIANHTNIYEALATHNAEKAKEIIRNTFCFNYQRLKNMFKEQGV